MALNWIGGNEAEHPMADPKQARTIVDALPAKDAVKMLEEVTDWLESLNQADSFALDKRLHGVELLDGAARRQQRELTKEYLSTPRVQKFQENRLWNAEYGFCMQLGEAYYRCIKECLSGFSGASAIRDSLPVITARAFRSLGLQLKWILLRYGLVEERIWVEAAQLYRLAEQKQLLDAQVTLYPGAGQESSAKREFLKALMLSASSTDGLPPAHQDIAERVIAHFAGAFQLSAKPEGCTHYFDLAGPKSPSRLVRNVQPSANLLFFGAGEALNRLNLLSQLAAARGAIPSDINLGGAYPHDAVLGVLKHLAQYWSDKAPARNSERRPTAARITVLPGAGEIFNALINPAAVGDDLDFSDSQSAESWIVENVSEGGCGAIIPSQKTDWIKVGTLIGMKGEVTNYLGIGLIRRISRDVHKQRRVGIQVLTKAAIPVQVSKNTTMSSLNFDLKPQDAILLDSAPDARGEIGVLLRGGVFNGRDGFDLHFRDQNYLLTPSTIVEVGDDFDWARFKVTQRRA
jgi:hypothetical protein